MAMKSIFDNSANEEIVGRIASLQPGARAVWGKMNAGQMLAHDQAPIRVAFGEKRPGRSFLGLLFGAVAKRKLSQDKAWDHGLPTNKSFVVADDRDFNTEKKKLSDLVSRFAREGRSVVKNDLHPFFGRLSIDEWDNLTWNHLDHHLRQFGA